MVGEGGEGVMTMQQDESSCSSSTGAVDNMPAERARNTPKDGRGREHDGAMREGPRREEGKEYGKESTGRREGGKEGPEDDKTRKHSTTRPTRHRWHQIPGSAPRSAS